MAPVQSLPPKYRQPRVRLIADLPSDDAERTAIVIELRLCAMELRRTAASMDILIALLTRPTPAAPRVAPVYRRDGLTDAERAHLVDQTRRPTDWTEIRE